MLTVFNILLILSMGCAMGLGIACLMVASSDRNSYKDGYEHGRADANRDIIAKLEKKYCVKGDTNEKNC